MMKQLTAVLLLAALFALPSSADQDFTFTIKRQKVIDRLPALCAIERAKLGNPSPWNANLCGKALMIRGARALHDENESDVARIEYRARIKAAKGAMKAPVGTPVPAATPTAIPVP
jgi:hypothetical protein